MAVTRHVVSSDGTRLGVELVGNGPPVLFVHGGSADRTRWHAVAALLRGDVTSCLLDRRGRGLSRNETAGPYDLAREAGDVAAVAEAVGASTVVGHSYGGLCVLAGARLTSAIQRIVVYEPAVATAGQRVIPTGVLKRVAALHAAGRDDEALAVFFGQVAGLSDLEIAKRRGTADWNARIAALPTVVREGRVVESLELAALDLQDIAIPVMVLVGSRTAAPLAAAAREASALLPRGELIELGGRGHAAMDEDPRAFTDLLRRLFAKFDEIGSGGAGRRADRARA